MQINPPYDGSEPCPACVVFSGKLDFFAYVHNFLNRCDVAAGRISVGKAYVKLNDLRRYGATGLNMKVDNPVVQELIDVARALVDACDGMVEEIGRITWTPEVTARVEALIPRAAAAMDAFRPLENFHQSDHRHSHGGVNVIRSSAGAEFAGFVNPDYAAAAYNYTVQVVPAGGDLVHTVCGTELRIHQHFKDNLARDPAFYGKVWCPTCRNDVPFAQFKQPEAVQ